MTSYTVEVLSITSLFFTTVETVDEWRIIFYITGGVHALGGIVYLLWGSSKLQSWSYVQTSPKDAESSRTEKPSQ